MGFGCIRLYGTANTYLPWVIKLLDQVGDVHSDHVVDLRGGGRRGGRVTVLPSTMGLGARVAGSRHVQPPELLQVKGYLPPPPPLSAPPSPSSSLTHLLDHRGRELRELQQIEGRQDLLEAGRVGEITDREVVFTLDL